MRTAVAPFRCAGCGDLRDPEPLHAEASTAEELLELLDGLACGDDLDEFDAHLSPCARRHLKQVLQN